MAVNFHNSRDGEHILLLRNLLRGDVYSTRCVALAFAPNALKFKLGHYRSSPAFAEQPLFRDRNRLILDAGHRIGRNKDITGPKGRRTFHQQKESSLRCLEGKSWLL